VSKLTNVLCAGLIGIAAIAAITPEPTHAAQIGEDMGKCMQKAKAGFKDKMCACKDSACAQRSAAASAKKNGPAVAGSKTNGANRKRQ
jgi:hypothetical protein